MTNVSVTLTADEVTRLVESHLNKSLAPGQTARANYMSAAVDGSTNKPNVTLYVTFDVLKDTAPERETT